MLNIRPEQMDILNADMRERFIKKTVVHVREVFPEQTKQSKPSELCLFVEEGMKKAASYNIKSEREVTLFIDLIMGLGAEFDLEEKHSQIHGILHNPELDQQEKIHLIYTLLEKGAIK